MSKIVFTNGVFDILHPGHFNLLVHCRALAGRLGLVVVGIDMDDKVNKDKGSNRPYFSEEERKKNILTLKYPVDSEMYSLVDLVTSFSSNEHLHKIIKDLKPTYIVKGSDWTNNVVGSDVAEVIYFNKQENLSTTDIENRILKKI